MVRQYSPWDVSVGNDRLPSLQFIAMLERMRAAPPTRVGTLPATPRRSMTQSVPSRTVPGTAQLEAMVPTQPFALRSRSPTEILGRRRTPPSAPGRAVPGAAGEAQPLGAPMLRSRSPVEIMRRRQTPLGPQDNFTPAERDMMRTSMFGGMAQGLSGLLAGRPTAGIGEMLLAAGAGGLAGRAAGQQGVRLGQQQDLQTQLAQANLGLAQSKAQREAQAQQALQQVIEDPSTPPEMKRALQVAAAGAPASAVQAMLPETMTPYQQESLELRRAGLAQGQRMTPYQEAMLGLRERELEEGRGQDLTALQRNVPFVAKALNIPESEATQMMLASASSRKTDEQLATEFAKAYVQNSFGAADPEEAAAFGGEMVRRLRGGAGQAPMVETPSVSPQGGFDIWSPGTWFGGPERPVEAVPGGSAAESMALPEADTEVEVGRTITLDDGSVWQKRGPDDYIQVR